MTNERTRTNERTMTRRRAGKLLGAAAAMGFGGTALANKQSTGQGASDRMPAIFVPHGGGPWHVMDRFEDQYAELSAWLKALAVVPPQAPRAILVISAHWEEAVPTVQSAARPSMLYDYYGFPQNTYDIEYPAPGAPGVALRVRELLRAAKIDTGDDPKRGFDHGHFVPLMVTWPHADIPTFQLSLVAGLDPARHLAIGRALAPLRDEGVLILGSGMSYHNMRGFFGRVPTARDDSKAFDDWLCETVAMEESRRDTRLAEWAKGPRARWCHPREEHLLPLMVVAGAGGKDLGTVPYQGQLMGTRIMAAQFG